MEFHGDHCVARTTLGTKALDQRSHRPSRSQRNRADVELLVEVSWHLTGSQLKEPSSFLVHESRIREAGATAAPPSVRDQHAGALLTLL